MFVSSGCSASRATACISMHSVSVGPRRERPAEQVGLLSDVSQCVARAASHAVLMHSCRGQRAALNAACGEAAHSNPQLLSPVDTGHTIPQLVYCWQSTDQYHSMYDRLPTVPFGSRTLARSLIAMAVQHRLQYSIPVASHLAGSHPLHSEGQQSTRKRPTGGWSFPTAHLRAWACSAALPFTSTIVSRPDRLNSDK